MRRCWPGRRRRGGGRSGRPAGAAGCRRTAAASESAALPGAAPARPRVNGRSVAHRQQQAEPRRLAVRRRLAAGSGIPRKGAGPRSSRAWLARRAATKPSSLLQLLPADGRLHVERLEVVAEVAVDVLVVVAVRQVAELPAEALAAGVVLARRRTSSRGPSRGTTRRSSSAGRCRSAPPRLRPSSGGAAGRSSASPGRRTCPSCWPR